MSEFEFRESSSIETGRLEREGLPPGYRMRADAHYVESLAGSARADRARESDTLVSPDEAAHHAALGDRDRQLFDQLTEDVAAIESAAAMLAADGSALGRRVGLDLIKAQSARASWLLRASALQHGAELTGRRRPMGVLLNEIRERVAVECRLLGVGIEVQASNEAAASQVPDAAVLVGVTGAITAQLGLVAGTEHSTIRVQATIRHGEVAALDVSQDTVPLTAGAAERFFDAAWVTRPGGWLAAAGAAGAKLAAERYGGTATILPGDRRGCTIRWTLPVDGQ